MKRTRLLLIFSVLVVIFGISACTSYSDGPKISLRSTRSKMNKTWRIKEAVKFGEEITELYKDGYIDFQEDGKFSMLDTRRYISLPPFTQDTALAVIAEGEWNLLDTDKFEVIYSYRFLDPYNTTISYNDEVYEKWEILRLTKSEFWMKNDSMSFRLVTQ